MKTDKTVDIRIDIVHLLYKVITNGRKLNTIWGECITTTKLITYYNKRANTNNKFTHCNNNNNLPLEPRGVYSIAFNSIKHILIIWVHFMQYKNKIPYKQETFETNDKKKGNINHK